MVLFFLVDTSGSMYGTKIGTVNTAIEEIIPELKDLSESIGIDIKDLKDSIDKSDTAIELIREASYKTASNILALKESAEKELNNLNES